MSKIVGRMAGCYSPIGKTFILTDENGNELTGVTVDQKQIFTANLNDIRDGKVAANDEGVVTGQMFDYTNATKKLWEYVCINNNNKTNEELASEIGLTDEELSQILDTTYSV